MTTPMESPDAAARSRAHEASDRSAPTRVELDLGITGRILDWANTLVWGGLAGSGIGAWLILCLGLTDVLGTDAATTDAITRAAFGAFLIGAGGCYLLGGIVSALRTLHYAKHVGAALRAPDAAGIVNYQAWTAVGETQFGRAFVAFIAQAIILMSVGAFMAMAAIAFFAEDGLDSSTLIALASAVVGLGAGIAALVGVKKLRAYRTVLCPDDPRGTRVPRPPGLRRVPSPASRPHRVAARLQKLSFNAAFSIAILGLAGFVAWGVLTGQVVMIGGRVRTLPDELADELTAGDLTAMSVVSIVMAITSLVSVTLTLIGNVIAEVQRSIAVRSLLPYATAADSGSTYPRKEVSEDALTNYSGTRRATGLVGAVAVFLVVAAVTPLSTTPYIPAAPVLIALAVVAVAAVAIADIATEPRSRRARNTILAAWPTAHAFSSRFAPNPTKEEKKALKWAKRHKQQKARKSTS
ncbi:hypothetical protein [Paramicrobacterium fandaimingii]|uniref:hypothetical protein n=1 Tax=Paramicrobacterium fandaimingii TaxID=2708079 RepID=UPI00142166B3|nr:hypothetical protein [Microbacterium fandaimingii]